MIAQPIHEPFHDLQRQKDAARFGMWVFLASEMLFFGALILGFTVYRHLHPDAMREAARETNVLLGTLNTAVLLTSSLTMAVADKAAEHDRRTLLLRCLGATALLGLGFLAIKGYEYHDDIAKHLVPGPSFKLGAPEAQVFFSFYWVMTGLHAVHLSIGIVTVCLFFERVRRGLMPFAQTAALPTLGLYWHLVDVVWIFLYPILYLGGRS